MDTALLQGGFSINFIPHRQTMINRLLYIAAFVAVAATSHAQKKSNDLIYVDKSGVMRYTADNTEASFFGVNYTLPFAHGYRMHKRLGIDHEKAINTDVSHMRRLGLNAFRVHVWDTEITDSAGNLLNNEHLRLYDFLVAQLEKYGIKVFLTPLAYWGNGYPEPDEKTGSFASIINNKQKVLTEEWAIKAQENYLRQLLQHKNPYTGKRYGDDQNVIALEINNEPHHTGSKDKVKEYISRMVKAVRSAGWTKPVFYNISESPVYADVVANSDIQGVTFQWYPTGLVANRSLKGNYLPHVDNYRIPFRDTVPAFRNKALMVYEFDAADIAGSYMYPAMARSFRTAGFQWATQFAYDPIYTAHFNTEYQTHYLNLQYTPSKAISLLIAAKVFQKLPRLKSYGAYPQDTLFDVFRVSYQQDLSEMNDVKEFYYSNSTTTQPKNAALLEHIAGVGSSSVVQYEGTGAYFIDKQKEDPSYPWILDVMPDVVSFSDPFERTSPKKDVKVLHPAERKMKIMLPVLKEAFTIVPIGKGDQVSIRAENGTVTVSPGRYFLYPEGQVHSIVKEDRIELIPDKPAKVLVRHEPSSEVTALQPLQIKMMISGIDSGDKLSLETRNSMNLWKTVDVKKESAYQFSATIPTDMMLPGIVNYRVMIETKSGEHITFPGGYKGYPYTWDNQHINESWSTYVINAGSPLRIFDPVRDREKLMVYNPDWRNNLIGYSVATNRKHLVQWMRMSKDATEQLLAWQHFVGDLLNNRITEVSDLHNLALRGKSLTGKTTVRITLIDKLGNSYGADVELEERTKDVSIPVSAFTWSETLLLPSAYPRFMPKTFMAASAPALRFANVEKVEVRILNKTPETDHGVEIEFIQLIK